MSNLTDFIGGAGIIDSSPLIATYYESGSFTVPETGDYVILISGGGGSGAASQATLSVNARASGGGSGDVKVAKLTLTASDVHTITIGAGGAAVTASLNVLTHGNNGGVSSFGSLVTTDSIANGGICAITEINIPDTPGFCNGGGVLGLIGMSGLNISGNTLRGLLDSNPATNLNSYSGGVGFSLSTSGYAGGGGASLFANGGAGSNSEGGKGSFGSGGGGVVEDGVARISGKGGDGFCLIAKL